MRKRLPILFIIVFSSLLTKVVAQGGKKVSVNFQSASMEQVVKELEALSSYHFFYDSHELDSVSFSFSANAITIPALLQQLFNNSPYRFSIDSIDNRIFVTKKYIIQVALPDGFWDKKKEPDNTMPAVTSERTAKQTNKLKEADNNKLFEIGVAGGRLSGNATLAGYIRDAKTGEPIYGATVSVDTLGIAVTTDQFGY
jgi:hypothetical protein